MSALGDTYTRALALAALGCSVIPIHHPRDGPGGHNAGKRSIVTWKPYQETKATDDQLREWFDAGRARNIGVVTGRISGLVVVDCDSEESVAWATANLLPTPWRVRTSKGEHWGYRHPGGVVKSAVRIATPGLDLKIDVRGDGGYVVAPGSVHHSGTTYEWVGDGPTSLDDLPLFEPSWLAMGEETVFEQSSNLPTEFPDGHRNDLLFKEGCRLRSHGWSQDEILVALVAINDTRCQPPLSSHEVGQIARSCARYEAGSGVAFPLTEAGDAEYFAHMHRDSVRFDHRRRRFLVSDEASGIWVPDPVEQLTQMTLDVMRARQRDASALADDAKRAALKWAVDGERRTRLTNALALARSVPPIADEGDNWDVDPFLLGVQNGVIDLRSGQFRRATPADRVTMRVRVAYDAAAECPIWLQTLQDIFAPGGGLSAADSGLMIAFMQRALGYSITGDCREECCFFAWGDGCNGKGTVMNTLGWLFGDYTDDMPYSTLERTGRGGGIPNDVAKLVGKRFITCSEVNEFHLNEARLKALTGRDPMTARFLHREFFTFIPVCKIWIATNNKPHIVGQDDGIWRRIHLIPFTQNFQGRENKELKDQLRLELPGILNWIVQGALLWQSDGLKPPAIVQAATAAYRHESNPVTPFIEACCVRGNTCRMQARPAFEEYQKFCERENVEPWQRLTEKKFGKAMRLVFDVDQGRNTYYLGVGLVAPQEDGLGM